MLAQLSSEKLHASPGSPHQESPKATLSWSSYYFPTDVFSEGTRFYFSFHYYYFRQGLSV